MKKLTVLCAYMIWFISFGQTPINTPNSDDKTLEKNISKLNADLDSAYATLPKNYFSFGVNAGIDLPNFENNLPYIDYEQGIIFGAYANYFWGFFGLGADVDYITNTTKNNYPVQNLFYENTALTTHSLTESEVKRLYYGLGPSLKFQTKSHRINAEVYGRFGLTNLSGGDVLLRAGSENLLLNAHNGFDQQNIKTIKAGVKVNFYLTQNIGLYLGGHFFHHMEVKEIYNGTYYAFNRSFTETEAANTVIDQFNVRNEACNCTFQSYGVTAGLSIRFGVKEKDKKKKDDDSKKKSSLDDDNENIDDLLVGKADAGTGNKSLVIHAIDKISKEKIPFADVVLLNSKGEIVKTGTTNHYGLVIFENLPSDDYTVNAKLYDDDLEGNKVQKSEFSKNSKVEKTVNYTENYILVKGKVTNCNTNQALTNVTIFAESNSGKNNKSTLSDDKGEFIIRLEKNENYKLYASKSLFISEIKEINTDNSMRKKSPFYALEICAEDANCGNVVKLNKIYYEFDKATLLDKAYPELYKLLKFLNQNTMALVEISSHTDARGSDDYNQKLSDARAQTVIDFLVKNGIERSRLIARGMGETKILNRCKDGVECSDSEHVQNRRTELKVICNP